MNRLICTILCLSIGVAHAESINLVCTHIVDGKSFTNTLTIVPPGPNVKGKVFSDDRDMDSRTPDSSQIVKNVVIGPSYITYDMHFEIYRTASNGSKEVSGATDSNIKISRVDGKLRSFQYLTGDALSLFGGKPTQSYEAQCEPRRANKF